MRCPEPVELTNLCLIENGDCILVEDRVDPVWHGLCLPGGHVELGETFQDAVIREVREETGLIIQRPKLCGIKQFHRRDGVRYVVFLYKTSSFSGELTASREGQVFWVKRDDLKNYELTPDFELLLTVFDRDDLNEFRYIQGQPVLY